VTNIELTTVAATVFQKFRKYYGKYFSIRTNFLSLGISGGMLYDPAIEAFIFTKAVYTYYAHHQAFRQHINYTDRGQ
jgi:hypothetical protein